MTWAPRVFAKLYLWIMRIYRAYCEKKGYWHYKSLMKKRMILKPLSAEQKREIRKIWAPKGMYNYDTHKLVYWASGNFDPKVVPELYVRVNMEMALNNQLGKVVWADKALFDVILPNIPLPRTLLRNMDGIIYDENLEYVSFEDAGAILEKEGQEEYFFKPSLDSGEGKGIQKISDFSVEYIKSLGSNWVIQEVLKVHPFFRRLNETAVPIMRLITFYMEGNVYMTSASMRIGMKGAITDYTRNDSGVGCIIVGITADGKLKDIGFNPNGNICHETSDGFVFGGLEIPHFKEAVELVKRGHKRLPRYRFLGWDVTIDESGQPVIIEYNINGPGVIYYQYANGPLFGDYFDVIYDQL